jgi:hypothetical protein
VFYDSAQCAKQGGFITLRGRFLAGASFMVIKRWLLKGLVETPAVMEELYPSLVRPGLLAVLLGGYL